MSSSFDNILPYLSDQAFLNYKDYLTGKLDQIGLDSATGATCVAAIASRVMNSYTIEDSNVDWACTAVPLATWVIRSFQKISHKIEVINNRLDSIESRTDAIEERLDADEARTGIIEEKLDAIARRELFSCYLEVFGDSRGSLREFDEDLLHHRLNALSDR